jgi:Gas vesicle synthesis protein GvpL/GvpF
VKTSTTSAVYVYCIVRAPRKPRLARVPGGVPYGSKPELEDVGAATWLVTSSVPLDVYGPPNLEPRLRNLDWVAEVALAHESVNEFFARAADAVVVPMKLFTMFSSAEKATQDVRARRSAIERAMRRVAGCEEWGIRATRRPVLDAGADRPSGATTGAGFLQAKKAARDTAAKARIAAIGAADVAFDRLKRHAKEARRRARGAEPGTNPPVLEAAFLVRATARAKFRAEAKRQAPILARAGVDLTVTGPWPAYSFVAGEAT